MKSQALLEKPAQSACLEIYTLGNFQVKFNNNCLIDKSKYSNKLWELFKYLLTNRYRRMPPEKIVDTLWPDQEYTDPKTAVHSLVYRLRKLLNINDSSSVDHPGLTLEYSHEGYLLKLHGNCWLDVDDFETTAKMATKYSQTDFEKAKELYRKALFLYKGSYLPEYYHKYWPMSAQYYYRRIYIKTLFEYLTLLVQYRDFSEIRKVCEQAFSIESFVEEEQLHVYFMQALHEEGKIGEAISHYEYIKAMHKKEFGGEVSAELQKYYSEIKNGNLDPKKATVNDINFESENPGYKHYDELSERREQYKKTNDNMLTLKPSIKGQESSVDQMGGFYCDCDFFIKLYELEQRRSERKQCSPVLALLTVIDSSDEMGEIDLKIVKTEIESSLVTNLRKGDVICRWNNTQFLVLLSGTKLKDVNKFLKRIDNIISKQYDRHEFTVMGTPLKELPK